MCCPESLLPAAAVTSDGTTIIPSPRPKVNPKPSKNHEHPTTPRLLAHECYCEPFAGSAAVFFRKPPSGVEILNDVCGDIVNFFRVIQRHAPEFLRMFAYSIAARAEFDRLRATPPEVLADIERAARNC